MLLLRLIFRNTFRHRLRTSLTIASVALAILAFGLLRSGINAWDEGIKASCTMRLITRNAISFISLLPVSYKDKIGKIEGAKTVSYGSWFGSISVNRKSFFGSFAVEPETYLRVRPEFVLAAAQREAFLRDRRACIIGQKTALRYGWEIGDVISLSSAVYPGEWEVVIRGVYYGRDKYADDSQLLFHWDYLNEKLKKTAPFMADKVGFFLSWLHNSGASAEVADAIDRTFKNCPAETLTEPEKEFLHHFVSMSDTVILLIRIVSLVVIAILLAIVFNTMTMTAHERISEYVVFKTLGFGGYHLALLLIGECLLITMSGCIIGVVLTPYAAVYLLHNPTGVYFPPVAVTPETIWTDIAASFFIGLAAPAIPVYRTISMRIVEGLRRIG
jgi:putative ABC transport system permease protein